MNMGIVSSSSGAPGLAGVAGCPARPSAVRGTVFCGGAGREAQTMTGMTRTSSPGQWPMAGSGGRVVGERHAWAVGGACFRDDGQMVPVTSTSCLGLGVPR